MQNNLINKDRLKQVLTEIQHFFQEHKLQVKSPEKPSPDVEEPLSKAQQRRLKDKISYLHAADLAHILEALPHQDRIAIWSLIPSDQQAPILLNLRQPVRETLLQTMQVEAMVDAAGSLINEEIADLAYLAQHLPEPAVEKILALLSTEQRRLIEEALAYPADSVGAIMDFSMLTASPGFTVKDVLSMCRKLGKLPDNTQHIYIVDDDHILQGLVPLQQLVTLPDDQKMSTVMNHSMIVFTPEDSAGQASFAFDRYELTAAPVVDDDNKLIGRICVDDIVDFIRETSEQQMLHQIGFTAGEDRFADIWSGAKNRWLWLAVNLFSAFIATRVISLFEDKILELVVLATLMPVVASTAGNIGNQACTLIIRSLALGQVTDNNIRHFYIREVGISLINGLVWGTIMGIFVGNIYSGGVGLVMGVAITINFVLTASIAISIPLVRSRLKLDPAIGAHVLVTFFADTFGFFIFLGMATVFL
jgi:magnesium transporter